MATEKTSKTASSAPAAKPESADAAAPPQNKAQAEFQRYVKRVQAQQAPGAPAYMIPVPMQPGSDIPAWAVPPSVAMLPNASGAPGFFAAMPHGGEAGHSSLTSSLGSTIRLGVDVINATLAGSVRLLNGIAGAAYGYGEPAHEHCGCGSGGDCCGEDCCGHSCCGCECCNPGVGTCC